MGTRGKSAVKSLLDAKNVFWLGAAFGLWVTCVILLFARHSTLRLSGGWTLSLDTWAVISSMIAGVLQLVGLVSVFVSIIVDKKMGEAAEVFLDWAGSESPTQRTLSGLYRRYALLMGNRSVTIEAVRLVYSWAIYGAWAAWLMGATIIALPLDHSWHAHGTILFLSITLATSLGILSLLRHLLDAFVTQPQHMGIGPLPEPNELLDLALLFADYHADPVALLNRSDLLVFVHKEGPVCGLFLRLPVPFVGIRQVTVDLFSGATLLLSIRSGSMPLVEVSEDGVFDLGRPVIWCLARWASEQLDLLELGGGVTGIRLESSILISAPESEFGVLIDAKHQEAKVQDAQIRWSLAEYSEPQSVSDLAGIVAPSLSALALEGEAREAIDEDGELERRCLCQPKSCPPCSLNP